MKALLAVPLVLLAAAAAVPSASAAPGNCVTLYDFPDNGEKVCWAVGDPECQVWEVRTTFLGTETHCLVGGLPSPPSAAPAGPVCENVASGPDFVMFLCVDPGASCRVYTVTYGHEGERSTRCVVA